MDMPWRDKLAHACDIVGSFDVLARRYLAEGVLFTPVIDEARGEVSLRIERLDEPSRELGLLVGDALHNMRSALDSIAFTAVVQAGAPEKKYRGVYFPITEKGEGWGERVRQGLPCVQPEHKQVFRDLQPWAEVESDGAITDIWVSWHPLWHLQELSRHDRHRMVHPVLARVPSTSLGCPEGVVADFIPMTSEPSWVGQTIAGWRIDPADRVHDVQFLARPELTLQLPDGFTQPPPTATEELWRIHAAACRAVYRVEVGVLACVTSGEVAELEELHRAVIESQARLFTDHDPDRVWDLERVKEEQELRQQAHEAWERWTRRSQELLGDYPAPTRIS